MRQGINPVTFNGKRGFLEGTGEGFTVTGSIQRNSDEQVHVSIGRMHLGVPKTSGSVPEGQQRLSTAAQLMGKLLNEKWVTVVLWNGSPDAPNILGHVVLDEEHFVEGLKHLFPNKELHDV